MGFASNNELDNISRESRQGELQADSDSWMHAAVMDMWSSGAESANKNANYMQAETANMSRSTAAMQAELDNAMLYNPYESKGIFASNNSKGNRKN